MNIDDMKNKISMELKNPITQQGFEIICRQLTEKKKQIEELKDLNEALKQERLEALHRNNNYMAQIEKMKCGQNCKHSYLYQEDMKCKFTYCDCINCKDKWQLKE